MAAHTAAAAAGADFPVVMDTCEADDGCGVDLLQDRVLDAVQTYTEEFLRLLDVKDEKEGSGFGAGKRVGGSGDNVITSVLSSVDVETMDESSPELALLETELAPESKPESEPQPESEPEPPALLMWDEDDGEDEVEVVESGEMENTTAREIARAARVEAAELRGEEQVENDDKSAAQQPLTRILSPMVGLRNWIPVHCHPFIPIIHSCVFKVRFSRCSPSLKRNISFFNLAFIQNNWNRLANLRCGSCDSAGRAR